MSAHLIKLPEPLSSLPAIRHPHTEYTLADAVEMVVGNCRLFGRAEPVSLQQVRDELERMHAEVSHTWLTVRAGLDVLDAALDGKDLNVGNRICQPNTVERVVPLEIVDASEVMRIAKLVEPAVRGEMTYDELRDELEMPDLTDDEIEVRLGVPCSPDLVEVSAYGFACYVFTRTHQEQAAKPDGASRPGC